MSDTTSILRAIAAAATEAADEQAEPQTNAGELAALQAYGKAKGERVLDSGLLDLLADTEPDEGFDGGAREPANESDPAEDHNAQAADLIEQARQRETAA